jgi:hypothetical protein
MLKLPIIISMALIASTLAAAPGRAAPGRTSAAAGSSPAAEYSSAVMQICAGALLFDHSHSMGTRSDALAVAQDIRASTARRLDRITALSVPLELKPTAVRWISSQRQLAALFARTWVRIYDAIDAAHTPEQMAALTEHLEQLVNAPARLRLAAGRLELKLHVPDCTGGG